MFLILGNYFSRKSRIQSYFIHIQLKLKLKEQTRF